MINLITITPSKDMTTGTKLLNIIMSNYLKSLIGIMLKKIQNFMLEIK